MSATLRVTIGDLVRTNRVRLDITQEDLSRAAGVHRTYISAIELGLANPTLDMVARIVEALGLDVQLAVRPPHVIGTRQRDLVHARCSAHVHRRLQGLRFDTAREVEIAGGRSHGWIDLLAFDRSTGTLYVIEVKTRLEDIGAIERQLGWYERLAPDLARRRGWHVRSLRCWLLVLSSEEVEETIRLNREVLRVAFPLRATEMRRLVGGEAGVATHSTGRGLATINPLSRRSDWLIASRADGRRGPAAFRDYADAARRFSEPGPSRRVSREIG